MSSCSVFSAFTPRLAEWDALVRNARQLSADLSAELEPVEEQVSCTSLALIFCARLTSQTNSMNVCAGVICTLALSTHTNFGKG